MRQYFKTAAGERFFFFEPTVRESVQEAFDQALAANRTFGHKGYPWLSQGVALFGDWRLCNIVGHRTKRAIKLNLQKAKDAGDINEIAKRTIELEALEHAQAAE